MLWQKKNDSRTGKITKRQTSSTRGDGDVRERWKGQRLATHFLSLSLCMHITLVFLFFPLDVLFRGRLTMQFYPFVHGVAATTASSRPSLPMFGPSGWGTTILQTLSQKSSLLTGAFRTASFHSAYCLLVVLSVRWTADGGRCLPMHEPPSKGILRLTL